MISKEQIEVIKMFTYTMKNKKIPTNKWISSSYQHQVVAGFQEYCKKKNLQETVRGFLTCCVITLAYLGTQNHEGTSEEIIKAWLASDNAKEIREKYDIEIGVEGE